MLPSTRNPRCLYSIHTGSPRAKCFFYLTLRERNIQVRLYLKIFLKSWDVGNLIIRTNFQESWTASNRKGAKIGKLPKLGLFLTNLVKTALIYSVVTIYLELCPRINSNQIFWPTVKTILVFSTKSNKPQPYDLLYSG